MKTIYHIGLHSTDEDRLLTCLLKNADLLAASGTSVTAPARFRPVLQKAMIALRGQPADEDRQERMIESVSDLDAPERVIFSNDSFLCIPARAIRGPTLYPLAAERAVWIRNLFPEHPAEFFLALRNPATLVPALQARFARDESFSDFRTRIEPEMFSWPDMVARLRAAVPDCALTIWCNEDSPLIWPEILQAMAGVEDGLALDGVLDFLSELITAEGMERLRADLEDASGADVGQRRQILSAALDSHAREDAIEEEYDLPGWTADVIGRLTEQYEVDVAQVAAMHGVTFLAP